MNVNEFVEKVESLSKEDRSQFLAYLYGSLNHELLKHYEVIENAFRSIGVDIKK